MNNSIGPNLFWCTNVQSCTKKDIIGSILGENEILFKWNFLYPDDKKDTKSKSYLYAAYSDIRFK